MLVLSQAGHQARGSNATVDADRLLTSRRCERTSVLPAIVGNIRGNSPGSHHIRTSTASLMSLNDMLLVSA